MKHSYTKNDIKNYSHNRLVQLLYKDCDLFDRLEMEFALEDDSTLMLEYQELLDACQELPKVLFRPSAKSLDRILAYSAAF